MITLIFIACFSQKTQQPVQQATVQAAPVNVSFPDWVLNPPSNKEEICATGSYDFKGNVDMARQSSTARARNELSQQLEVKVQGMFKSFIEEGQTDGESYSDELVSSVSKQVTNNTLNGTEVKKSEMSGTTMYTMVCLNTEKFAEAFDNMNNVSDKMKQSLRTQASKGFAELDSEIEKLNDQKSE